MQNLLPIWARVPKHKKKVEATEKGWVVAETGELLRSVSNLPDRLEELRSQMDESYVSISNDSESLTSETVEMTEEEKQKARAEADEIENELGEEDGEGEVDPEPEQDETQEEKNDVVEEPEPQETKEEVVEETDSEELDEDEIRAQYQEVFGKKPHHMKKVETMKEEIEAELKS